MDLEELGVLRPTAFAYGASDDCSVDDCESIDCEGNDCVQCDCVECDCEGYG